MIIREGFSKGRTFKQMLEYSKRGNQGLLEKGSGKRTLGEKTSSWRLLGAVEEQQEREFGL